MATGTQSASPESQVPRHPWQPSTCSDYRTHGRSSQSHGLSSGLVPIKVQRPYQRSRKVGNRCSASPRCINHANASQLSAHSPVCNAEHHPEFKATMNSQMSLVTLLCSTALLATASAHMSVNPGTVSMAGGYTAVKMRVGHGCRPENATEAESTMLVRILPRPTARQHTRTIQLWRHGPVGTCTGAPWGRCAHTARASFVPTNP